MSTKRPDPLSEEFGTAHPDAFFPDAESSERREKFRTIDRQILSGEIPILTPDELEAEDPLLPRDHYEAWFGPYPAREALPVNRAKLHERAERLRFEAEHGPMPDVRFSEPPPLRAEQPTGEELQETLFSEFEAEFGRVDRNAALQAAARLAEQGKSYQFDNRAQFYDDIARELKVSRRVSKRTHDDADDDDGRAVLPSSGGRAVPAARSQRADEPGDFLKELNAAREPGWF